MPVIRRAVVFLLALSALRCATSTSQIHRILEQQQAQQHIPGLAFAVVKDGRVVYLVTLGHRDIERNLPVTPETMFPIGSCTKAFTSMAVALSADRGLLSLDDHPRKVLSYFYIAAPDRE